MNRWMSRVSLAPVRVTARAAIFALLSMVGSGPAFPADATAQQQIVDKARLTLEAFASDDHP